MNYTPPIMTTIAAGKAKQSFGVLMDTAQREPVTIEKNGRPAAVVLSKYAYDQLQAELQDFRSEAETAFLMRGKNGERLMESIKQADDGDLITVTIAELEAMAEDEG